MKVLISNGTSRFHLAPLAASLQSEGMLGGFLAAGWPVGWQKSLALRFPRHAGWQRFLDRVEPIKEELTHSSAVAEALNQGALIAGRRNTWLAEHLDTASHNWYAWNARRVLGRLRPDIYHFRSCFGLGSVSKAKAVGAVTLCDHSIAHPAVLTYMVENNGRFPPAGEARSASRLEKRMQEDLSQADHVLVNSDFVKQTCLHAGMDADRIHVIYTGVDDKYLNGVPDFDREQLDRRAEGVLYAGSLQVRKGLWTLIDVFGAASARPITVVGAPEPALSDHPRVQAFLGADHVRPTGIVSRTRLAQIMVEHSIFVFPSLCEGSARVIFDAMACGCFVITTPNAGSIVKDGIHGRLVPAGDAVALAAAVEWAMANRRTVAEIGWANAELVDREYRQAHYASKVRQLYGRMAAMQHGIGSRAWTQPA